jgi:hypothetical protein
VRSPEPPADPEGWAATPIDRFVAARLREKGLRPVADADHRTLLRRAHLDLLGLPPSVEETADFIADASPDAFERALDRLLASPRCGERWARHWLDVARYADTAGDNADYPIPEARLYRDYVIDAFNADKPFDAFVREQIAGDLLARDGSRERHAELVTATTFLALSRRYATAPYELWHLTLEDTIDTVGQAFLGLTLRCARCHDHKYDPVTMTDYYGLYGIFESTQFPWAGGEELASKRLPRQGFVPLIAGEEASVRRRAHDERVKELEGAIVAAEREPEGDARKAKLDKLRADLLHLQRSSLPADLPGAYAVQDGAAHDSAIHLRGEPGERGPVAPRGAIAFVTGSRDLAIPAGESGRRQLAEWLVRPDNPLTARVIVNRLWQHHFGRGIVATPSNFGTRGASPTHPELLDHLAARLVEGGWSLKAIHRQILTSRTWRLSSRGCTANEAVDPEADLRWRQDRRRLDAEAIRDALLLASGRLDLSRPGPHPFPPMETWGWTQHSQFKAVYTSRHRSVYLMTQRLQRHPFLALFDGPDPNTTTEKRTAAATPQQSLYLLNSPEIREEARAFASRVLAMAPGAEVRLRTAYELAFGRAPDEAESARGLEYLEAYRSRLTTGDKQERELEAWTSLARVLLTSNEMLFVE